MEGSQRLLPAGNLGRRTAVRCVALTDRRNPAWRQAAERPRPLRTYAVQQQRGGLPGKGSPYRTAFQAGTAGVFGWGSMEPLLGRRSILGQKADADTEPRLKEKQRFRWAPATMST